MSKTWLVTGTSTGFGRSLARFLANQKNVNLVATARNTDKLSYLDQYDHGQILKAKLDVTNKDEIKQVVKAAVDKFGGIDVLDNNAGLGYISSFEEADDKDAKYMFDVNVWGLVHMTQAVLPVMRKQHSGTVVNMSSLAGIHGAPALSFYNATKYAVEGLMDSFNKEVQGTGIKVMLVEPSGFRTDWGGRSSKKKPSKVNFYSNVNENMRGIEQTAGHEAGNPDTAAQIVYNQVTYHFADLPLHLPIGKSCVENAIKHYSDLADHYKKMTYLAISADNQAPLKK
ncbi:short-chain dehydrogenase/reductase [Philodulcilactobacillus myokoensis]|uniref:Short-chain dehydrogenase/reductase n=1 Tax=Philodulcilactobacillus myokoensis TaxID=2929573 RepID=A0A9W6AZJ3_9LACO|nr:SDR family NAD(P)-dependent oxidoreductase [Philodulcilactobacillus myokoensis]GLB46339.1 short-chain dehydrogenase/reductase [Philodulcilactobacillus myokoensis]